MIEYLFAVIIVKFFFTFSKSTYTFYRLRILLLDGARIKFRDPFFYNGNKKDQHFCTLLDKGLKRQEIRIDCEEFEKR
jgi:hypothetical protein